MLDGDRIRLRRLKLKLSQGTFGKRIRQDQAYVSRLEAGKIDITVTMLERVADALQVSPNYLLGRTDEPDKDLRWKPAALARAGVLHERGSESLLAEALGKSIAQGR